MNAKFHPWPDTLRRNADAMEAFLAGKSVEYYSRLDDKWHDETSEITGWGLLTPHRIKTTPKARGWSNPDDVPGPICWIRLALKSSHPCDALVVGILETGVQTSQGSFDWESSVKYEYSTDRKTWHKCEVIE